MPSHWNNCRNILCVRLDQMGDLLMTTPAFRAIKESIPHSRITLLCSEACREVVPLIPTIDDHIIYHAPWMKASSLEDSSYDESIIKMLRFRRFDAAIIFNVFSQNPLAAAYLCYLANIPKRLSYCRENPYQLLTHWIKDPEITDPNRHEVQRQLDLVGEINCHTNNSRLDILVTKNIQDKVKKILGLRNIDIYKPIIVVHPGASALSRQYPPELFAQAINHLSQRIESQIIFTGTKQEVPLVKNIQNKIEHATYSLAGALNFSELCALISFASVLITNNTGPSHIAAAVGTPVVVLYALTNPQHTPWMVSSRVLFHDVPCRFCYKSICPQVHHNCLRKVRPKEVSEAALNLIQDPLESPVNPLENFYHKEKVCIP
jgi:lipopolysaccharide heptosyltransferase II